MSGADRSPWVAMKRHAARFMAHIVLVAALIALLDLASAPSPALFGAFIGTAALSLAGTGVVRVPSVLSRAAQGVLGATIATQIDGERLRGVGDDLPLLVVTSLLIVVASVALGQMLTRRGVSVMTATLASVAGGASSISSMADDLGADRRVVVVVQYLRVVIVLATLAVVLASADMSGVRSPDSVKVAGIDFAFAFLAVGCGTLAALIRPLPAPALLGSLVSAVLLGLTPGFGHATVPAPLGLLALAMIGAQAATGFTRETFRSLRGVLPLALTSSILLIALCAGIGAGYSAITGARYLDGYLATSPGGLPVVLVAVIETGGDAAVVSSSQLIRLLTVVILLPIIVGITRHWHRKKPRRRLPPS